MSEESSSAMTGNSKEKPAQKPVILIVDDEFDITSTFSMLFQMRGFDTLTANNGGHALEVMQTSRPDIILSDCMMPIMDGIEFSNRVLSNPAIADIPIILMSAAPHQHDLAQAACNVFLRKPIRFKDLFETIQKLLAAQQG